MHLTYNLDHKTSYNGVIVGNFFFFLLRMWLATCEKEEKRQSLNFDNTPNHTVVSKTTLVCTAVYSVLNGSY